ncbi:dispersed gene family protein 1 (DGF-1), putative, partial [Trypanosoma cruzi]
MVMCLLSGIAPLVMVVVWSCAGGGRAMVSLAWWCLRFFVSVAVLQYGLSVAGCFWVPISLVAVV